MSDLLNLFMLVCAALLSMSLEEPVEKGQLIINLRAEAAPAFLGRVVRQSVEAAASAVATLEAQLDHLEHFRPGKHPLTPEARLRMSALAAFGTEVIATAVLLLVIFCATDERNKARPQVAATQTGLMPPPWAEPSS